MLEQPVWRCREGSYVVGANRLSRGAADQAGLKAGDVVTKVGDRLIESSDGLVATIRSYAPGTKVTLTYVRAGESATTTVTLTASTG